MNLIWILAFVGFLTVGGLAGGSVVWLWQRKDQLAAKPEPDIPPEHWLANEVDQVAETWAEAHGRPEAKPLLANKLHLALRLERQRRHP